MTSPSGGTPTYEPGTGAIRARAQPVSEPAVAWGLVVADAIGLVAFLDLAAGLRLGSFAWHWSWQVWVVLAVVLAVFYLADLYRAPRETVPRTVARVLSAVVACAAALAVVVYLTARWEDLGPLGRVVLATALGAFTWWACATRWALARWLARRGEAITWLVVGGGSPEPLAYLQRVLGAGAGRASVLLPAGETPPEGLASAGTWDDLRAQLPQRWSGIVLASERELPEDLVDALMHARLSGVRVYDLTDFVERFRGRVPSQRLRQQWLTLAEGFDLLHSRASLRFKRLMDVLLSLTVLALTLPLVLLAALAVALESRGGAFYRQVRVGRRGTEFTLWKIRTMRQDAEAGGARWAAVGDPRVTRIGRLLRRTRVDELPQLWNILVGDMSFIGPRPERPGFVADLERQLPYYSLRHLVKPGLTGWAQVNLPYGASVDDAGEKLEYDLYYIKNYSLWLDLVIVARTGQVVLSGSGAR